MTYDQLKSRAARGDQDAARELLPQARARRDAAAVLACWQVLHSARHSAWKALEATLRAVTSARTSPDDGAGLDTTQLLRSQVVALALIDGCRRRFDTLDVVAKGLLDLASCVIDNAQAARIVAEPAIELALQRELREVLVTTDEADALRTLEAARALFSDTCP